MSFHAWNQQLNFIVFCVLIKSMISFIHRTFIGEKKGVKMAANFFTYMFTNQAAGTKPRMRMRNEMAPSETVAAIEDINAAAGREASTAADKEEKMKMMLIITANIIVGLIGILSLVAIVALAIMGKTIPDALAAALAAVLTYYGGAIASYFNTNKKKHIPESR